MQAQVSGKRKAGFLNSFVFHSLLLAGCLGGLLLLLNGSISFAGEPKSAASLHRHKPEPQVSRDGRGPHASAASLISRASGDSQEATKVEAQASTHRRAATTKAEADDAAAPKLPEAYNYVAPAGISNAYAYGSYTAHADVVSACDADPECKGYMRHADAAGNEMWYKLKDGGADRTIGGSISVLKSKMAGEEATETLSGHVAAKISDDTRVREMQTPKQIYTPPKMDFDKILEWSGVVKHVPKAVMGDWMSETQFLERVMRVFGKQRSNYKGYQRMQGLQPGKIFDDDGMFAFTPDIKSVAIDVGAANNPLSFDLDIDASQVGLFVEPLQWLTLQNSIEADSIALKRRGGCTLRWDGFCVMHRFYVFPAAVSNELGHAQFHATGSPYCGSLESFTAESNKSAIDPTLMYSKNPEISGIFAACYRDAKGKPGYVPTISLKALIERIPKHIAIKYVKIDAQGHDWNVLLSAGDQIKRIEYVRFEMQVDPPEGRRLVKNIPSYAEVESHMSKLGFKHAKGHACFFEHGASPFSKAVNEMECVFCRKLPCVENARPPLGENPRVLAEKQHKAWLAAGKPKKWPPPQSNSSTGSPAAAAK